MKLRDGLKTGGWLLWACAGYPVVAFTVLALASASSTFLYLEGVLEKSMTSDFLATSAGYALLGLPLLLCFLLLGSLAGRLRIQRGFRFLGFIWAAVYFVAAALIASSEVRLTAALSPAAIETVVWLLAAIGWWLGIRLTRLSGERDESPLGRLGWTIIVVAALALLGVFVVYWISSAA